MGYQSAVADIQNIINEYIGSLSHVKCSDVGLDHKCGMCYIDTNDNLVIVYSNNASHFRHHGGLTNIRRNAVSHIGEYTVFAADFDHSGKLKNVIDAFHNRLVA